jgi:DNA-binding transcriptional LysR family regulator
VWLETVGVTDLKAAGSVRFSHYDQVVRAAVGGQGVAIGRRPLIAGLLADGALVAPFATGPQIDRAYYLVRTTATAARKDVDAFVEWVVGESAEFS